MPATMSINGLTAVSVRLFHPWQGPWVAEVDFDLDVPTVPSGPAVLKIGDAVLVGTIDSDASGKFGEKARARVIAGGGGWHRPVSARQFHNDAGVFTLAVITATAAEVGERVVVVAPAYLGVDYERFTGPASRVLAGLDWYVTFDGVTTVGPRPPTIVSPTDVDVLSWDSHERRADLASTAPILPGTIIVDPRFGTITVRDVEQTFDGGGARAIAWCADKTPTQGKLAGMLASAVRELGGLTAAKTYRYRVVAQGPDGRLTLQAISPGAPDSIALTPWYGVPGLRAELITPGSECAVAFLGGDPAQPVVVSFHGGDELATGVATQASQAPFMALLAAFVGAVVAAVGTANPLSTTLDPTKALTGAVTTAGAALLTAAVLPTNYSLRTKVV